MEDLDETIIAELKEKAIERPVDATDNILIEEPEPEPEPEPVKEVKKSKKVRSEKQKAAFEKARKTRAENLKIKKLLDAEKKEQKKKEKEIVKAQVKERLASATTPQYPVLQSPSLEHRAEAQRQVVNNYYYYGNPDWHSEWEREFGQGHTPPKRKKKVQPSRRPPTPSSESETDSEVSEVDEPPSYRDLQEYDEDASRGPSSGEPQPPQETSQPKFKFRFA